MPFNYAEYQAKTENMTTDQLQKEWENYTRQIAGGATSTATSVLFSPLTAGISLMGLGLSAPRIHNARKKREIIEKGLQERGSTHNTRSRDVAGSMALSGAISVATLGLAGPLADAVAGEATGKGVEYAVAHLALDGVGEAVEHKHGGHLKKKAEQDLKRKAMQAQLAQMNMNGGQQQMMANGQMVNGQMTMVNGQMVYQPGPIMGGFQQPALTTGMPLPQHGAPIQNQQQIQWQNPNPSMGFPGVHQPNLQLPGLQPGMVPPPRPHSAAPDNHYGQYAMVNQQPFTQQPPQYQQVQDSKFILNVVPSHQEPQMTPNGYPNEKSAAYNPQPMDGTMTPLPLYSPQAPGEHAQDGVGHPNHIDLPATMSMEEEIALLKFKLLQMELEKRGMSATISGPLEISLDPPKPKEVEKQKEEQTTVAIQEISATTEVTVQPLQLTDKGQSKEQAVVTVETHVETQTQVISEQAERRDSLSARPVSASHPMSPAAPISQTTLPPVQPQQNLYSPGPGQHIPPQPQYIQQPPLSQQYTPQPVQSHQRHGSLVAPPIPAGRPVSPAPPQQYASPPTQQTQYQTQPSPQSYQVPPPPLQSYTLAPAPQQPQQQSQTIPLYQPQPVNPALQSQTQQAQQLPPVQVQQPQYPPINQAKPTYPQNQTSLPAQIYRQDSGYYSQATTPMQQPQQQRPMSTISSISSMSSVSSISSPVHRHPSISAVPAYNPQNHVQQPQQQQQYGGYNPQHHGRTSSVSSISSPTPPPPYFAPPPGSQQPVLAGKIGGDYFNQGGMAPTQMGQMGGQMQMGYGQVPGQMPVGINEKMGMHYPQQNWGQGQVMMGQPGMVMGGPPQQMGGVAEPNYGPPPAIPQRM